MPRPRKKKPAPPAPRPDPSVEGVTLADLVRRKQPGTSWAQARRWVKEGKVFVAGERQMEPHERFPLDADVSLRLSAPKPADSRRLQADSLVHVDTHVVVVRKPPHIATVPYEDQAPTSLQQLVRALLNRRFRQGRRNQGELGVVQRLDKPTSGLLVLARNWDAKRALAAQFRDHSIERRYLAVLHGVPSRDSFRIESQLVKNRGDGLRGSTKEPNKGQRAITHVRLLDKHAGLSLVECRLETGRTHQIRIHLSEMGHPLVGEKVYIRRYSKRQVETAPRLLLHATSLGFRHPATDRWLEFEEPMPEDMQSFLENWDGHRGLGPLCGERRCPSPATLLGF